MTNVETRPDPKILNSMFRAARRHPTPANIKVAAEAVAAEALWELKRQLGELRP